MKHETIAHWLPEPDTGLTAGYWQARCPDCGWNGHRYTSLVGADEDGQHHTRREYYEMGRRAHERGDSFNPVSNGEVVEAIADLSVGDPRVSEVIDQYQRGWTDSHLFTPL